MASILLSLPFQMAGVAQTLLYWMMDRTMIILFSEVITKSPAVEIFYRRLIRSSLISAIS